MPALIKISISPFIPVKMFLKASSTFVESKADVSMNERLFFSRDKKEKNDTALD